MFVSLASFYGYSEGSRSGDESYYWGKSFVGAIQWRLDVLRLRIYDYNQLSFIYIQEGDKEIATKMQELALSEGALPRHLHTSLFTISADQRMLTNRSDLSKHEHWYIVMSFFPYLFAAGFSSNVFVFQ